MATLACWLCTRVMHTGLLVSYRPLARDYTGEYPLDARVLGYIANTHNLITAYAIDEAAHHSSGRNGRAQTAS